MSALGAFMGVECSNCDSEADRDVEVLARDTGEVVRDVYACESCFAAIDVSDAFAVTTEPVA